MVCCFIGIENINLDGSFYVQLNSWFTVLFTIYLLAFPLWAYLFMRKHRHNLKEKEAKFGELWADMRSESKSVRRFVLFSLVRRIILAEAVVRLRWHFTFQQMSLFVTSTMMIVGYLKVRPYREKFANKMEIFNETCLLLIGYHIFCFSEWVPDVATRYYVGFSCVFFVVLGLFVNFSAILRSTYRVMT